MVQFGDGMGAADAAGVERDYVVVGAGDLLDLQAVCEDRGDAWFAGAAWVGEDHALVRAGGELGAAGTLMRGLRLGVRWVWRIRVEPGGCSSCYCC